MKQPNWDTCDSSREGQQRRQRPSRMPDLNGNTIEPQTNQYTRTTQKPRCQSNREVPIDDPSQVLLPYDSSAPEN